MCQIDFFDVAIMRFIIIYWLNRPCPKTASPETNETNKTAKPDSPYAKKKTLKSKLKKVKLKKKNLKSKNSII